MGFRSLLSQATQISGSFTYDDTLSLASAESYEPKTLEADLNYIRSQFKVITGEADWFDAPVSSLQDFNAGISGSFANIQSFTGQSDVTDASPTYTSTNYVTQSNSLEAAIGELDAQLGIIGSPTLQSVTDNGATTTNAITVSVSGSIFNSLLITDDLQVGGNILVDGTVDGVDIATFSSNVISFTGMTDETDGSPTYSSTQYVTNGDSLETAIGKLDAAIEDVEIVKVTERLTSQLTAETAHTLPGANSYTLGNGANMDVYLNGQLLQADAVAEERDYDETSTTQVTFHFNIRQNSFLTYVIRK